MYNENEVNISNKWLNELFSLGYDSCLIGGWAVYLLVTKNFEEEYGRKYIGSKDIDMGFHINIQWNFEQLKNSDYMKLCTYLDSKGFTWIGYRYFKNYDYETKNELSYEESKNKPEHELIKLYIDPIVDEIHPDFKCKFNMNLIDEPVLSIAFDENRFIKISIDRTYVKIPHPHLLLAMKLKCVRHREKEHKRLKDISDIFALIWYTDETIDKLKNKVTKIIDESCIKSIMSEFNDEEIKKVADFLEIEQERIKAVFRTFMEK